MVQDHRSGLLDEGQSLEDGVAVLGREVCAALIANQGIRAMRAEGAANDLGHGREGVPQGIVVSDICEDVAARHLAGRRGDGENAVGTKRHVRTSSRCGDGLLKVTAGGRANVGGLHLSVPFMVAQ